MIGLFNTVFGGIFTAVFYPFRGMSPWVGMTVISVLTALLMLLVYRYTSNQEGIRTVKDRIKAHLLELRLYQDSLRTTFASQGKILRYNVRYIGYATMPMLVMIVPVVLILVHLDLWFGYESLKPGETAILKVKLQEGVRPSSLNIALEPSPGAGADTPALRIDPEGEVDWRIRGGAAGVHDLVVQVGGERIAKQVAVGEHPLMRISPARVGRGFLQELLNPGEEIIARGSVVKSIEIAYQGSRMSLFGWHMHWLVAFFALSILFGFGLKGFFKIEV